ncbi:undecaprenyl-diphosphate phosphatase [Brevibacterium litoralis]|uniref:undecaprenyl-diphosphate phosphatase n=1 Tax=Brevibacterium litoralis TaxID=3138935 RepID=UPI0032EF5BDC
MDWVVAAVLGVVQGLTEFLPISSSAHVRIVGEFINGGDDPGAFYTAIIQIGTEAAVIVYFWRDIVNIVTKWFKALFGKHDRKDPEVRLGWLIIIGSIPIGVLGLLFEEQIETTFRSLWIVATMLIVFGIFLGLADRLSRIQFEIHDMTWKNGILYGLAQALALIPGVSRSGGTITAGRLMGFSRPAAARYAFLLAIPAVMASGLYGVAKSIGEPMVLGWGPTILSTVISFGVGLAVIAWLLNYLNTKSFMPFVIYRIVLGVVIFVLLGTGVLSAT